jgi:hypothetical protein
VERLVEGQQRVGSRGGGLCLCLCGEHLVDRGGAGEVFDQFTEEDGGPRPG